MSAVGLFYPALAQVGLTFILLLWMGRVRLQAIANEKIRVSQIALGQRAWPERAQRISNAFHNQLEIPILFYAALLFALHFDIASALFLGLAWAFVAARIVHAWIHTTGGHIRHRFISYALGAVIVLAMWIVLTIHIVAR